MLFRLFQEHLSQRRIAQLLEVSHSTIFREMRRTRTAQDLYRYDHAQAIASRRRKHCRRRPVLTAELQIKVIEKLNHDWSPEQISGRFRLDKISTISHQSIYNWLWSARQSGGELYRKSRRKREYFKHKTKSNHILDRRMLRNAQRLWKQGRASEIGSLIRSFRGKKDDPCIMITSVERKSRFLIASLVERRDSSSIGRRITRMMNSAHTNPLTLTSDNGTEFAMHRQISRELKCDFFFARPYHPRERGTNENTNGRIRQYMPAGTAFKMDRKKLHPAVE